MDDFRLARLGDLVLSRHLFLPLGWLHTATQHGGAAVDLAWEAEATRFWAEVVSTVHLGPQSA